MNYAYAYIMEQRAEGEVLGIFRLIPIFSASPVAMIANIDWMDIEEIVVKPFRQQVRNPVKVFCYHITKELITAFTRIILPYLKESSGEIHSLSWDSL